MTDRMTHETTPDIWFTKRKHRLQKMLHEELISVAQYDTELARVRNIHSRLIELSENPRPIIEVKYLGETSVIITGFKTDKQANIYITFKLRSNGGEYEQELIME